MQIRSLLTRANIPFNIIPWMIIIVSVVTYFWDSKTMPSGYHADATSIVISAACINATGADEFNVRYPIVGFRSFGEYKGSTFIYLVAIAGRFFGFSHYNARILGMLFGLFGVILSVLLARKMIDRRSFQWTYAPFFALILLSSWVLVPQRITTGVTLSIFMVALVLLFTWHLLNKPDSLFWGFLLGVICGFLPYTHNTLKILYLFQFPLLLASIFYFNGFEGLQYSRARGLYIGGVICVCMGIPLLVDVFTVQHSLARYHSVKETNFLGIFSSYLKHISPDFWFFSGDKNLRHHTGYKGMLNIAFLPFFYLGIIETLKRVIKKENIISLYLVLYFLLSFVPASLTSEGLPHALRTIIAVPAILLFSFMGSHLIFRKAEEFQRVSICIVFCIIIYAVGTYEAIANVSYYHLNTSKKDKYLYTYFKAPEIWKKYDLLVPFDDRSIQTLNYRYYRIVECGDIRYCTFRGK